MYGRICGIVVDSGSWCDTRRRKNKCVCTCMCFVDICIRYMQTTYLPIHGLHGNIFDLKVLNKLTSKWVCMHKMLPNYQTNIIFCILLFSPAV